MNIVELTVAHISFWVALVTFSTKEVNIVTLAYVSTNQVVTSLSASAIVSLTFINIWDKVMIGVIFLFIRNSQWSSYCYSVKVWLAVHYSVKSNAIWLDSIIETLRRQLNVVTSPMYHVLERCPNKSQLDIVEHQHTNFNQLSVVQSAELWQKWWNCSPSHLVSSSSLTLNPGEHPQLYDPCSFTHVCSQSSSPRSHSLTSGKVKRKHCWTTDLKNILEML